MIWILGLALVLAGGTYAYALAKKARAHTRWALILRNVASKLDGRPSPGSIFDTPELRVHVNGSALTLKLRNIHKPPAKCILVVDVECPPAASAVRLYVGWDVQTPRRVEHLREIPYTNVFGLEGRVSVRGDDARVASQFLERVAPDLIDLRREACGRGMELMFVGGHLNLAVHGILESAHLVEQMIVKASRLSVEIDRAATVRRELMEPEAHKERDEREGKPGEARASLTCTLCAEVRSPSAPWVQCRRCGAPYHRACWWQSTGCTREGCPETRSDPIDPIDPIDPMA